MLCSQCSCETSNPKFCSRSCSAKYWNKKSPKRRATIKTCSVCGKPMSRHNRAYCSHKCHSFAKWEETKQKIKASGIIHPRGKTHSSDIAKRYIASTQGNRCSICEQLPFWNGKPLILILDHINGEADDWQVVNLRLVCPNCDTQLPTFKSKNKNSKRKR